MKISLRSTIALLLCILMLSCVILTSCKDTPETPIDSNTQTDETESMRDSETVTETKPYYDPNYDPDYDNNNGYPGYNAGGYPDRKPDSEYDGDGTGYESDDEIESEIDPDWHETETAPDWYETETAPDWYESDTEWYETDTDYNDTWHDTDGYESWDTLEPDIETEIDTETAESYELTTPEGLVLSVDPGYTCWVTGYVGTGTEVIIPAYVDYTPVIGIREYAFSNNSITSVEIPETVEYIEYYAFFGCTNLTTLNIPEGVQYISYYTFDGCYNLIQTENGVSYVDKWIIDCDDGLQSVVLRNDTVGIADMAFDFCNIENIDIPESVTHIGSLAFESCQNLTSITIPENVKYLGNNAFLQSGIESVTFEDPDGWDVYDPINEISTPISIPDASTAAEYLKSTYCYYSWIK